MYIQDRKEVVTTKKIVLGLLAILLIGCSARTNSVLTAVDSSSSEPTSVASAVPETSKIKSTEKSTTKKNDSSAKSTAKTNSSSKSSTTKKSESSSSSKSSSSSSGSATSKNNSSNNSGSSSSSSSTASQQHTHTWVHHDATGHYDTKTVVDQEAYDDVVTDTPEQKIAYWKCNADGYIAYSREDALNHSDECGASQAGPFYETTPAVTHTVHHDAVTHTEQVWVQDSAAYDQCSSCGAIR